MSKKNKTRQVSSVSSVSSVSVNVKDFHQSLIKTYLPRFTSSPKDFAFLFHPLIGAGAFPRDKFQLLMEMDYVPTSYEIVDANIFEIKLKDQLETAKHLTQDYWLVVLQPTNMSEIVRQQLCILSLAVGVEVKGTGVLLKSKEDALALQRFMSKKSLSL